MLDDLRKSASEDYDDSFSDDDDVEVSSMRGRGGRFLGMTAIERMFISIFLFLTVCVVGIALLLATGRIQL